MQGGHYADPFQEAERRQRQRDHAAQNKMHVIPPVQGQWMVDSQSASQPQMQLMSAATASALGKASTLQDLRCAAYGIHS